MKRARLRLHKVLKSSRSPVGRSAMMRGVLPGVEHPLAVLPSNGPILDVGANSGQFTLFAYLSGFRGQIYAFEPLVDAHRRFARVTRSFSSQIDLRRTALGRKPGSAQFFVTKADDSSSLRKPSRAERTLHTRTVKTDSVTVDTLDRQLRGAKLKGGLLKLDVQGSELDVLSGGLDVLRCMEKVYVEASFVELYEGQALASELIVFLTDEGFELTDMVNLVRDQNRLMQADLLFNRKFVIASARSDA